MADLENDDRAAIINRQLKAYFNAVEAHGDPDDLMALVRLRETIDRQVKLTAVRIHGQGYYSLAAIGRACGVSKQSVEQWKKKHEAEVL